MACMGMQCGAGTALLVVATLAAVSPRATPPSDAHPQHLRTRHEALVRLQQVLQLPGVPSPARTHGERRVRKAPEFMMQLQRRLAHPDGVLRSKATPDQVLPHGARVVRSFIEQEPIENHVLRFNVSLPNAYERVLGAEVRIYRLRRPREPLLLRMYQVEEGRPTDAASADQHRLLGVQAVRAGAAGAWHVFNVLPAVRAWQQQQQTVEGKPVELLVTTTTLSGVPLRDTPSPVARRGGRHSPTRQPLLVMYNSEEQGKPTVLDSEPSPNTYEDVAADVDEYDAAYDDDVEEEEEKEEEDLQRLRRDVAAPADGEERRERRRRRRRQESIEGNITSPDCTRQDLYVDFSEIGWDSWIIAPHGYNAFQCVGQCPYPLGPVNQPTNHATVQSIMHQIHPNQGVAAPCCSPLTLSGLSIMFADENTGDIVLKLYEGMVASTCGCQ